MRRGPTTTHRSAHKVVALYTRPARDRRQRQPQESELKAWILERRSEGYPLLNFRWYRGAAGGRGAGPGAWEQLVRDIEAGQISELVCWRLDRLGRTCSELVKLFELLAKHQVNLISLKDQLDLSTPEGKRVVLTLASVALYESESRSERILAGQAAARRKGIRWGGSTKGRRLKVTPELEARVKRLQARGKPISHIAQETGLSRPTVYRVLDPRGPTSASDPD